MDEKFNPADGWVHFILASIGLISDEDIEKVMAMNFQVPFSRIEIGEKTRDGLTVSVIARVVNKEKEVSHEN